MAVQRASREGRTLRWLVVVPIVGAVLDDVAYVVDHMRAFYRQAKRVTA